MRFAHAAAVTLLALSACGDEPATSSTPPSGPVATTPAGPTQPASHQRMLAALREIAQRTGESHHYQGDGRVRRLRRQLDDLGDRAPWKLHLDTGVAELQLGQEEAGLATLTKARDAVRAGTLAGGPAALSELTFNLGVGWLRRAETENCCADPTPESCILPLTGTGLHSAKRGSTEATTCFLAVLEIAPPGTYWHLAAEWLLNLAAMTLGTYPDSVPQPHRIPPAAFAAERPDFPRFTNVAARLGLDTFSLSGGVAIDDFDRDGDLDLFVSSWSTTGQLRYFINDGAGGFTDHSIAAGLAGLFGGLNLVQADYDNDGDLDLLILRGAWLFEHGKHPNSLLRNNGDNTFTDVTFDAGLGNKHYPTQTAAWADYDRDGDLDLFIGNEHVRRAPAPGQLFRNEGDGTFVDVATRAGVATRAFTKAVTWGDYDGDGWPDLYVSNNGAPNHLFRNRGDGTFEDVAATLGVSGPEISFPAWFWDYDNDGALDLYVSSYGTGIGHLTAHYRGANAVPDAPHERARMYHNDGTGRFADAAPSLGLTYPALPMGSNFGDLDNDGWLDFYLGTGNVHYYSVMPNVMFHNRGGTAFEQVTMAGGFGHLQKGHAIAFADLDADGDLDVFEQMGGAYAGDGYHDAVFENPGFGNHWLAIELAGTTSNRCAIGARIRVDVAAEDGARRSIYRWVNSGGSFGANPLRQTIGLGKATEVARIEIEWPSPNGSDATPQVLEAVAADQRIRITEGTDGYTKIGGKD